jgi:hypothetical protein
MALKSNLFAGDARLEACALSHSNHVMPGSTGPHVRKIQGALAVVDGAVIDKGELDGARYGASTARAVLAYKKRRAIVNRAYQSQADDIVGIMTIQALDADLLARQVEMKPGPRNKCPRSCGCRSLDSMTSMTGALARAAQRTHRPEIAVAMRAAGPDTIA